MLRLKKIFTFTIIIALFISCGGWDSKERAEFLQECRGGLDKEDLASLCECVYDNVANEFTYNEYKKLSDLDYHSFTAKENERLKKITPDIKECY